MYIHSISMHVIDAHANIILDTYVIFISIIYIVQLQYLEHNYCHGMLLFMLRTKPYII